MPYLRSPLIVALFAGVIAFLFVYNLGEQDQKPDGAGKDGD